MVSANYVRVGRLVRIIRGPRQDKVGVITDIIDANRVLVENPEDKKMWRHVQNLKNVEPLKFNVTVARNAPTKVVKAAMAEKNVLAKWSKSKKATKIAAAHALANSTDFERYQLRVAKRSRAHWTRKIFDANDTKAPVSWHATLAKKLERAHKKFEGKHLKARHDRIKKYFTALKAKKAKKGKGKAAKK